MSIFDQLRNSRAQMPNMADLQKYAGQLQNDPVGFLRNMGFNLPNNVDLSNPNAIISHLMQTSQINGGLLGKAQQLMNLLKR